MLAAMEEMTVLHSQLSSIMEKLLVCAVTEIKQLVCEYCAALRVELSREKQDNSALREELKLHRPVNGFIQTCHEGHGDAGAQLHADQMKTKTGWRNEEETAEEQEERTLRFADCKFEPVTVKHEDTPEEQPELRGSPVASAACSQVGDHPQHQNAAGQTSQFCSEPTEGSKDLHTDCKQSVETRCQLSISPSGDQFIDLGFHIKSESKSPDLQTPSEDVSMSFELQQGFLCQIYSDCGGLPVGSSLPDTPALTCSSSLHPSDNQHISETLDSPGFSLNRQQIADRDTSSHQGNPLERGSRSCNITASGVSRITGRFRYQCDFCGKGFPFLSMMKGHRLTHTGERTQVCGHCGKSFIRRSHLTRHERLHLDIRPFICHICGRKFSRSTHLNAHMKTHSR